MQYRFKLGNIVSLGFGSMIIIMAGVGIISKLTTNRLVDSERWVTYTYKIERSLNDVNERLLDAETGQRGFILTLQDEYLEPYHQAVDGFEEAFDELRALLQHNQLQTERLNELEQLAQEKLDELNETVTLIQQGKRQEAIEIVQSNRGEQLMDEIRAKLAELLEEEERLLVERQQLAQQTITIANLVSFGGTTIAILFGVLILLFIVREIVRPINQVANTIASSTSQIATTVEQQARTATQQASSVNETTTTMDELGASSRQSAEQAEASAAGARQALNLADNGTKAVEQTLAGMATLREKVGAIADQILRLSEQTNQIGSISGLVGDLANQTNMLALNAAVEAVRAGEHGKGFSVVASEIRKLADQSKKSAEKINLLVSDIQSAINSTVMVTDEGIKTVDEGVRIAQATSESFLGVADAVNNVVLNSQQISLNIKQQAIAVQQVVAAMNALNIAAQESASGISQIRIGTEQLNDAALDLKAVI